MTYESLRHFADSYALVVLGVAYLSFCGWAFRPGSRRHNSDAANLIFKDSDHG